MDFTHETMLELSKVWGLLYLILFSVGVVVFTFWPSNRARFNRAEMTKARCRCTALPSIGCVPSLLREAGTLQSSMVIRARSTFEVAAAAPSGVSLDFRSPAPSGLVLASAVIEVLSTAARVLHWACTFGRSSAEMLWVPIMVGAAASCAMTAGDTSMAAARASEEIMESFICSLRCSWSH